MPHHLSQAVRFVSALLVCVAVLPGAGPAAPSAQQTPRGTPSRETPPRDTPPRNTPASASTQTADATARLTGRVLAADTGRPLSRARVFVTGNALPGGRGALTAEDGSFELTDLPEGRYTVSAGKAGFITLAYGQRRPFQPGTPLQIQAGEHLSGIEIRVPRGSVIAGQIFDETGEPLPGAIIRVLRQDLAQGAPRLVPAGAGQTDDRGSYRVWGLNPGDYYVSAIAPPPGVGRRGGDSNRPFIQAFAGRGFIAAPAHPAAGGEVEPVGYAPTFYPGVGSAADARAVSLGLGTEAAGVDFSILLVHTARVSGRVVRADGTGATGGNIALAADSIASGARSGFGSVYSSRVDGNGDFTVSGVPPGRYLLRARAESGSEPQFAVQPLTVAGDDLSDLTVVLARAATVDGRVSFRVDASQQPPDPRQVRVIAPSLDGDLPGAGQAARVDQSGAFTMSGVQPGRHLIRAQGAPRGWTLEAVLVRGRDVIDQPLDIGSGEALTDVSLVFTDRLTELSGTIADDRGAAVTDYTLLAFSVRSEHWQPPSRHIATARPDQDGRFQLRGLPPGEYYVVPIDPGVPGEWLQPAFLELQRDRAERVVLAAGEVKTQNFTIAGAP
ncbi:MAG: collagen binding domain-containing protein [Vicinamibacterales bacterium]